MPTTEPVENISVRCNLGLAFNWEALAYFLSSIFATWVLNQIVFPFLKSIIE